MSQLGDDVQRVRRRLRRDGAFFGLAVGDPGVGKSILLQHLARALDPTFVMRERTTFSGDQAIRVATDVCPRYGVLILDELVKGGNARRASSGDNVRLMTFLRIFRELNIGLLSAYPYWVELDPAIQRSTNRVYDVVGRGLATPYTVHKRQFNKEIRLRRARTFRFPDLPAAERAEYKELKESFVRIEGRQLPGQRGDPFEREVGEISRAIEGRLGKISFRPGPA